MEHRPVSEVAFAKPGAVLCLAISLSACQSSVWISDKPVGHLAQPPELGHTIESGDDVRCRGLRAQLVRSVATLQASLHELQNLSADYTHDAESLQSFETTWRTRFIATKNELYSMPSCKAFVAEWTLAMAAWRDIFRHEKETIAALRSAEQVPSLEPRGKKLDQNLTYIRSELENE
jgi:hypothetical protein